jgi:hypothetical protein
MILQADQILFFPSGTAKRTSYCTVGITYGRPERKHICSFKKTCVLFYTVPLTSRCFPATYIGSVIQSSSVASIFNTQFKFIFQFRIDLRPYLCLMTIARDIYACCGSVSITHESGSAYKSV